MAEATPPLDARILEPADDVKRASVDVEGARRGVRRPRARSAVVLRAAGAAAFLVQLGILLLRSRHQYAHFNLSIDFAIFHQAWHQIAHGDLNPQNTLHGYPYWREHFELIMWPLALVSFVHRSGVTLLWIQDLAMVLAEAVVFLWVLDVAEDRGRDTRGQDNRGQDKRGLPPWTLALGALILLLANPWIYSSLTQDFHFEALDALFVVAAAREFWLGRSVRGWFLVGAAFLTGDVAGTYVVGVGLSVLLVGRPNRRTGAALVAAGAGWVALVTVLGANRGSAFGGYAYLTGRPTLQPGLAGVLAVLGGVARHPSRAWKSLSSQWTALYNNLAPDGLIGLLNPVATGIMLIILIENVLNGNRLFIHPGFQNIPVYLFGAFGTVAAIDYLARRPHLKLPSLLLGLAILANTIWFASQHSLSQLTYKADGQTAAELQVAARQIPADAEVIATYGVLGPLAGRRYIYPLVQAGEPLPIRAHTVMIVIAPNGGNQPLTPAAILSTVQLLRNQYHATEMHDGPSVFVFRWNPPPDMKSVVLLSAT